MRKIEICEKEYEINCNALTYINFKKIFNRGIFEDLQIIENFITKQVLLERKLKENNPEINTETLVEKLSRMMLPNIDEYIEAVTRIAFICINTANPNQYDNYEKWLLEIERINTTDKWIVEVTEFAVDCFC